MAGLAEAARGWQRLPDAHGADVRMLRHGRPAGSSWCRSGAGEAFCRADRGEASVEESMAVQIGAGRLLQCDGLGSLRRRRWLTAVAAGRGGDGSLPRRREKAALVAAMAATLGDEQVDRVCREVGRSRQRLMRGNKVVDVCGAVTPNGPPRSRGGFFGRTQLGRVELLNRTGLRAIFRMR
jgi:hypothetical protein